jgi:hypothetical protein
VIGDGARVGAGAALRDTIVFPGHRAGAVVDPDRRDRRALSASPQASPARAPYRLNRPTALVG